MVDEFETFTDNINKGETEDNLNKVKAASVWGIDEAGSIGAGKRKTNKGLFSRIRAGADNKDNNDTPIKSRTIDNDLDSIPVIPDLEQVLDEDFTHKIAKAPNISVTRVATYNQLDQELYHHSGHYILDGKVDLKILTRVLAPENEVLEEDKEWKWDTVFSEVSAEINSEQTSLLDHTKEDSQ